MQANPAAAVYLFCCSDAAAPAASLSCRAAASSDDSYTPPRFASSVRWFPRKRRRMSSCGVSARRPAEKWDRQCPPTYKSPPAIGIRRQQLLALDRELGLGLQTLFWCLVLLEHAGCVSWAGRPGWDESGAGADCQALGENVSSRWAAPRTPLTPHHSPVSAQDALHQVVALALARWAGF